MVLVNEVADAMLGTCPAERRPFDEAPFRVRPTGDAPLIESMDVDGDRAPKEER